MKKIIEKHKELLKIVKEQTGLSDYGMYWLAFLEGGLTIWFLEKILLVSKEGPTTWFLIHLRN